MIKSGFSVKFKKQFFLSSLAESKVTVIFLIYRVWLSFDIDKNLKFNATFLFFSERTYSFQAGSVVKATNG